MRTLLFASLISLFSMTGLPAHAQILQAQCGPEAGKGFTTDSAFADGPDGWYSDKVSAGETVLRIDAKTRDVNIRFKDSGQRWKDAEEDDGAFVSLVHVESTSFLVLVVYPEPGGAVETYVVSDIANGRGTLIHTTTRADSYRPILSRIFSGTCIVS